MDKMEDSGKDGLHTNPAEQQEVEAHPGVPEIDSGDKVFGDEADATIHYRTLSWQMVAVLMIGEIVGNGMLSLPQAFAAVGIVPGVVITTFLGAFALYTALVLVDFKINHPEVHSMGDAGNILGGPLVREILAAGTVIFAICATGSQFVVGQVTLSTLSNNGLCVMLLTGIFAIPTLLLSFSRTLDNLSWLCIPSCLCILVSGVIGMGAASHFPAADRQLAIANPSTFFGAFGSILNPVFSYAGHFMFFIMISEMKKPSDAKKAAVVLQVFATAFYVIFGAIMYVYLGQGVLSPAFSSLPKTWAKVTYGIALPNFLIAGSLYSHTAAKLIFVRLFRGSKRHIHNHTFLGWSTWTILILIMNGAAFVLAVGVPIFADIVALAASLFASWFTYGIPGAFWLHDSFYGLGKGKLTGINGLTAWRSSPFKFIINVLTFLAGLFICVGGTYVSIKLIISAYNSKNGLTTPFAC